MKCPRSGTSRHVVSNLSQCLTFSFPGSPSHTGGDTWVLFSHTPTSASPEKQVSNLRLMEGILTGRTKTMVQMKMLEDILCILRMLFRVAFCIRSRMLDEVAE